MIFYMSLMGDSKEQNQLLINQLLDKVGDSWLIDGKM